MARWFRSPFSEEAPCRPLSSCTVPSAQTPAISFLHVLPHMRCLLLFLDNSYPHVCVSILGIITLILLLLKNGKIITFYSAMIPM